MQTARKRGKKTKRINICKISVRFGPITTTWWLLSYMTASILNHGCDAKQKCGHKTHLRMTFNEPRQNVLGSTHLKQCGVTRAKASSHSNLVQLSQYDMGAPSSWEWDTQVTNLIILYVLVMVLTCIRSMQRQLGVCEFFMLSLWGKVGGKMLTNKINK